MESAQRRTAIITGGSRGIGRQSALRLAADGFRVVVGYAGRADLADEVVHTIEDAGGEAIAIQGDVAEPADVERLFDAAESAYGGVDVVVHSAGVMHLAPLADADLDVLDAMHRTNIRGTFVVGQQAARRLRDGGALITFSSTVTRAAPPGYSGYAATKGATEAITMILAKELADRGITVNAVAPGPTATDMFLDGKGDELVAQITGTIPAGRLGQPEDISAVVSFLAGPGRWINGQTVFANGGMA